LPLAGLWDKAIVQRLVEMASNRRSESLQITFATPIGFVRLRASVNNFLQS
jgi:hypothetical protein